MDVSAGTDPADQNLTSCMDPVMNTNLTEYIFGKYIHISISNI